MSDKPDPKKLERIAEGLRDLAVPVDTLYLDPRYARKHSLKSVHAIKLSIMRFGIFKPLAATMEGKILAGNGLYQALCELRKEDPTSGHWDYVPCVRISDDIGENMTEAALLGIVDNRTAELSTWDTNLVRDYIEEFKESEVDPDFLNAMQIELIPGEVEIPDTRKAPIELYDPSGRPGKFNKCPKCGHEWENKTRA